MVTPTEKFKDCNCDDTVGICISDWYIAINTIINGNESLCVFLDLDEAKKLRQRLGELIAELDNNQLELF